MPGVVRQLAAEPPSAWFTSLLRPSPVGTDWHSPLGLRTLNNPQGFRSQGTLMTHDLSQHVPVMQEEILRMLDPSPGAVLVDGTAGGGGHLRTLLQRVGPTGQVIAIDRDPQAVERLTTQLPGPQVQLFCSSYADLPQILDQLQIRAVDGVLLDLGISSDQLADPARGFSFQVDGPLDLRFNPRSGEPAWRLIERLSVQQLADLIYTYGEDRASRRIARAIVQARQQQPIRTSFELAQIVRKSSTWKRRKERIDPATRTFQALRIAVNQELQELETALRCLPDCLLSWRSAGNHQLSLAGRPPRQAGLSRRSAADGADEEAGASRSRRSVKQST